MRRPLAAFATLLAVPSLASAQPGVAPSAVPVSSVPAYGGPGAVPVTVAAPVEPTAPPALVGIAKRSAEDPAADRAYLAHTALVAPRGTITFQARAPLAPGALGQINASLTDRISVGVGAFMIFIDEEGAALTLSGKLQLVRGRRAALAVALDTLSIPDEDETLYMPSLVASFCADGDACNTLLSLHLTGFGADGEEEMPIFGGASFSVGKKNRFVGEIHFNDDSDEYSRRTLFGGFVGGRFGGSKFAFDAGLGFAGESESQNDCIDYCDDYDNDPPVIPYPFIGMSARL
jgi:hypothetical protein